MLQAAKTVNSENAAKTFLLKIYELIDSIAALMIAQCAEQSILSDSSYIS